MSFDNSSQARHSVALNCRFSLLALSGHANRTRRCLYWGQSRLRLVAVHARVATLEGFRGLTRLHPLRDGTGLRR